MRQGFFVALAVWIASGGGAPAQSYLPAPTTPRPAYLPAPSEVQMPAVRGWPPAPEAIPQGTNFDVDAHRFKLQPASHAKRLQERVPVPPTKAGSEKTQGAEQTPHTLLVPGMPLLVDEHEPTWQADPRDFHRVPRGYKWYGRGEYLLWWFKDRGAPPLLTIGPPGATQTIGGSGELIFDNQERHGGRFTAGRWLGLDQTVALEGSYFFLGERVPSLDASGGFVSRPFFNTSTPVPAPASIVVSAPGVATGSAHLEALSRMWGAEGNLRWELARTGWGHFDWLLGVRTLALDENLIINTSSTPVAGAPTTIISDRFGTHNNLWAGQLGFEGELNLGPFFIEAGQKMALGANRQVVDIQGNTITMPGGVTPTGLLARPSNSGRYSRSPFTVLLESNVNAGMNIGEHVRIFAGYTFLFLNNAARPGDQIDERVQFTPGVGAPAPLFLFRDTQFWAQGLSLGLELRF